MTNVNEFNIIKATKQNIRKLFSDMSGNLYYKQDGEWKVLDGGFTLPEVQNAMLNNVEFIYKKGPVTL